MAHELRSEEKAGRVWLSRDWLWGLILVLVVIFVYQPVWYAGYIWDDDGYVNVNSYLVGPLGLSEIWTTRAADISPLTKTMFWVEHVLWGSAPLPYHLMNVLLYGACAVLLWRVLRSLQVPGAWLGAALWALHPVEVESVAWISEMKNTQSGLFFLLSILFFVKWLKTRDLDGRTGSGWNYGLTLLFAALAMASKSSTVILPVILCLCAWWVEGRWQWRNLARVVPIFLMSFAASALSIWTVTQQGTVVSEQSARTWSQRLLMAGDAVWFYLGKLVWPHPLITIYPRWQIDAGWWVSYLPLLAVIIVLFILWLNRESWSRPWFFAFAYFLASLLPVLGLVDHYILRYSLVFDHFQYLASMGPLALAGAGLARFSDLAFSGKPWLQSTFCAGLLLVLGTTSWQRTWVYQSAETLWADELVKNPNCWAGYNNLGNTLLQKGQVDEAIAQFQKALEINPNYAEARTNLGLAFLQKSQVDEAIAQYQKALEINPNYAVAHYNLGNTLAQLGHEAEAIAQYETAIKLDPNLPEAHYNLGNALIQTGHVPEAAQEYEAELRLNPDHGNAHTNLGNVLLQLGRVDEALREYGEALRINPNDEDVRANLGVALMQVGRLPQARTQFEAALRLDPHNATALAGLSRIDAAGGPADAGRASP